MLTFHASMYSTRDSIEICSRQNAVAKALQTGVTHLATVSLSPSEPAFERRVV